MTSSCHHIYTYEHMCVGVDTTKIFWDRIPFIVSLPKVSGQTQYQNEITDTIGSLSGLRSLSYKSRYFMSSMSMSQLYVMYFLKHSKLSKCSYSLTRRSMSEGFRLRPSHPTLKTGLSRVPEWPHSIEISERIDIFIPLPSLQVSSLCRLDTKT